VRGYEYVRRDEGRGTTDERRVRIIEDRKKRRLEAIEIEVGMMRRCVVERQY
jgi:hypothetical protein